MKFSPSFVVCLLTAMIWYLSGPVGAVSSEPPVENEKKEEEKKAHPLGEPQGAKRLTPDCDVWVDMKKKRVIIDGEICFREGLLELFACIKGTKEHESVVAVKTKAYVVHAALLSVGAEAGSPVQFHPKYVPAKGTEIEIDVMWVDKDGKERIARAQDWVRDLHTKKQINSNWVFGGSAFWVDEQDGKKYYQAEGGDLICVSNFSSALLDVPVESPQVNHGLMFEAFTDRIPPLKTKVRLVLKPKLKDKEKAKKPAAKVTEKPAQEAD